MIEAGTYPVSSIKTAEAIKVVENSQRDINIAFMNELAMVFDRMGIDTSEVVEGMNTKWNALGFKPGLVGGHCIGVDPYYFTYEAEKLGYHSQIIRSGRRVNDAMGGFVAETAIREMVRVGPVSYTHLDVYKRQIQFHPERWKQVYLDWLANLKDWCISRQLWWGHRIPMFYCDECGWEDADVYKRQTCRSSSGR